MILVTYLINLASATSSIIGSSCLIVSFLIFHSLLKNLTNCLLLEIGIIDFFGASIIAMSSILLMLGVENSSFFVCYAFSALIYYYFLVSAYWSLMFAFNLLAVIHNLSKLSRPTLLLLYTPIFVVTPVFHVIGLLLSAYIEADSIDNTVFCTFGPIGLIIFFYIPLALILLLSLFLYSYCLIRVLVTLFRATGFKAFPTTFKIQLRLTAILLVRVFIWVPLVISLILRFASSGSCSFNIFTPMGALFIPMQGLLNACIFGLNGTLRRAYWRLFTTCRRDKHTAVGMEAAMAAEVELELEMNGASDGVMEGDTSLDPPVTVVNDSVIAQLPWVSNSLRSTNDEDDDLKKETEELEVFV